MAYQVIIAKLKVLVICLVLLPFYTAAEQINFSNILHEAESIKSSNPAKFSQLVSHLNDNAASLTPQQTEHLIYLKAYQLSFSGRLAEGIAMYKQVAGKELSSLIQFKSAMSIVNNSAYIEDWQSGLTYANRLLEKISLVEDTDLLEQIYFAVSTLFNNLGQHKKAIEYSETLLSIAQSPRGVCLGYLANLEAILNLGQMDRHMANLASGIQKCRQINEVLAVSFINYYSAEHFFRVNQPENTKIILYDSLQQAEATRYPTIIVVYYATLAKAHLKLGEMYKAEEFANKVIDMLQISDAKPPLVSALKTLYEIAKSRGNFEQALDFHERYAESQEIFLNKVRERELAVQIINLEIIEKNNQILLLDSENALLKTQSALAQEQSRNNRLALVLAIFLLVVLFFWLYRSRRLEIKLRKLAETDELTGINNRHFFNQHAQHRIRLAEQQGQAISFVLFDLDHFKKVNDTFGHQVGDWALCQAVQQAKSVCRAVDLIGRMGGEEFAILLPGCGMDEALKVAEICRKSIARIDSSETGYDFKITASFGVADAKTCGYSLDKLFGGADSALYHSKDCGRNRVYSFDGQQMAFGAS